MDSFLVLGYIMGRRRFDEVGKLVMPCSKVVRVEWGGEAESGMLAMKVMNVSCRSKMSCHAKAESPN